MVDEACALVTLHNDLSGILRELVHEKVIENQVKMKMDLENVIALVSDMNKDLKKLKNKDQAIIKQNNKIEKQHKKIFELFEENINPNSSGGYSYGD